MIDYRHTLGMGMSERHIGTKMLRHAANFAAEQQSAHSWAWQMMVTKNIYPEVARAFGSTTSRVERNIRTAIKAAGIKEASGEVIARLAEMAKEDEQNEDGVSFRAGG